jgi:type I restriction enzyme S subunit
VTSAWPSERLKHVADVTFSSVDKKSVDGEARVRLCNYTEVYYSNTITADMPFMEATASIDQVRSFGLRAGDVLITKDSETADDIGVAAFVPDSLDGVVCGYHLAVLRPKPERIDPKYLFWSVCGGGTRQQMTAFASGVTRYGLRFGDVGNLRLLVPEFDRQRAVVRFLDGETAHIDAIIDRNESLLAVLKERRQSLIDRATVPGLAKGSENWLLRPLRKVAAGGLFTDGDWIETPYITDEGIRLIQTGNIGLGVYREQGFRYVSDETFKELRCTEVVPGDVLISRLADPVGRACLAPDLGVRMITAVDVCILRPGPGIDRQFLVAYLSSSAYLSLLESIARGGTRDRVSRDQLGQVEVPVPPSEEQQRIARLLRASLRSVDSLSARIGNQIELLLEHRQVLITAAVTGQLDEVAAAS